MSDTSQSQTIEQAMNKTDLGHVLYENRKTLVAVIVALLIGVTAFFTWKKIQRSNAHDTAKEAFEFQNGVWAEAKLGKRSGAELVKAFGELDNSVRSATVVLPLALEMSKFLYDKGEFSEANEILSLVPEMENPTANFFLGMQKAVTLEKVGKVDEAITVLEKLVAQKDSLVPGTVAVDLGRLYLAKGEKGKAQTQFDYVINTYPNDEAAKVAKLYLAEIAK